MDDSSVRVALRVRPQIPRELIDMCRVCTSVTAGEPQVWLGNDKAFTFDYVFDMDSVQASIYESCISSLIEGCFDGFNATVFAYGQTGSGKTYTMGTGFDMNVSDDEYGIIPRAVDHLFQGIEERQRTALSQNLPPPEFKIICQFMELYNEEVIDLFDTARDAFSRGRKSNIKIQEDPTGGICVIGLANKIVNTKHETMQCLKSGALSRTTASTQMNVQSSRSHAVFTLHIKQQRLVTCEDSEMNDMTEFETLTAKFHFVDLAGSERLKRTGATGERAKEGISINCGLLALGNVISALGDKTKRGSHVPYRDSKLTRLLQDSLGGNSQTIMIACISPSDRDFMETLNTLKYANRARNIKNKITVNQDKTSQMVSSLRMEIQRLQLELLEYKQGKRLVVDGVESVNDMYHENMMLQTENNHLRTRIKAMQETIEQLKASNVQLQTEKTLSNWIVPDNANSDMTPLIQGYLKEIEDLRAKLLESENTSHVLRRTVSRAQAAMSPRPSSAISNFETVVDADETASVDELIESAKLNIVRLKRREKRQRLKSKIAETESEIPSDEHEKDDAKSEDEGTEDGEELSDLSSESDSEEKENTKLEKDLVELTCEIGIKQRLIEELELSQRRLHTLRQQYEEKLMQLQTKMRVTQDERDKILSNFGKLGNMGNQNEEKVKRVKEEYEKKLNTLHNEMRKLQEAKKRHAQLVKNQSQYEQQLKTMRSDLADMKKAKVRLMNKMKEETLKHKESETRRNREIAQLKKESRQHENQIRTLTSDKRLKESILRRKQDEVSALRKMVKPMSDKVAGRTLPRSKLTAYATKRTFSAKLSKVKWQAVENGITKIALHRQAVNNLEKNMERYLEERNKLRKYIERLVRKRDRAILQGKHEMIKYYEDQVESAKVNIDYVQENIAECQTNIMQMEEPKEGTDVTDAGHLLNGLGVEDVKYVLGKLLLFAVIQCTIAVQKDTNLKEVEANMQQIVKNNSMQEQLLEHVIASKGLDYDYSLYSLHDEPEPMLSSASSRSTSPTDSSVSHSEVPLVKSILNADAAVRRSMREKVRRKTATPEELLGHGAIPCESYIPMVPIVDETEDCNYETTKTSREHQDTMFSNGIPRVPSAPGSLKMMASAANGKTEGCTWPPFFPSPVLDRRDVPKPSEAARTTFVLPSNDIVLRRMTRSLESNPEPSPPSSPMVGRKLRGDNVFSRLTSQSSQFSETNRDRGVITPYNGRMKTAPLLCTHVAEGHVKAVLSVDATDDLLFSASKDRTVKIWDLHTCTELDTLDGHPSNVTVVKYSPRTNLVFSVSSSFIKVWDIRESPNKCIKTLSSVGLITHSATSGSSRVLGGNGKELQINDIALNQSGTTFFAASGNIVRIWDLRKFLCTGKLSGGHQAAVMCLAVSDEFKKNLVVTGSKDHYIKVFEVADGISGMHTPRLNLEPPHYDGIESLTMTGCYLFSGSRDMCIKKWDLSGNELLKQSLNQAHKDWICGLKVLPGGQELISGCRGGYLKLWSVETCSQLGEIKAHANPINSIATNSSSVFSASSDGTIGIWRMKSQTDSMELGDTS